MFKVEEIKKSFKDKEVLKGVSFSVLELSSQVQRG